MGLRRAYLKKCLNFHDFIIASPQKFVNQTTSQNTKGYLPFDKIVECFMKLFVAD